MTPEDRAALREAAQAVLDTQGHDPECHAYTRIMSGTHPAAVLSLLDDADERDRLEATLNQLFKEHTDMIAERDRLLELLASVLSSLEIHLPYAPWHGGNAVDESGSLIVHPDSLIARARAALETAP